VTTGDIDAEQRRVAERLILSALRRFHREQPLAADLRLDALFARVRAASSRRPPPRHRGATPLELDDGELREVVESMVQDGRIVRTGRRVRLPGAEPALDPEMAERVERLLAGLRESGAAPPRVEGLAARVGITPTALAQLRASGMLRQVAPGIDYPADVWTALSARVEEMRGPLSVARLRDELHTTRRHAEAILAALGRRSAQPSRPGTRRHGPA
jgi:hypothetical protein